jgi:tRNA (adenine37-N6)-methyltransferase
MTASMESIAVIRSPFREKFSTPRQPGLTPSVTALVEFNPDFCSPEAVRGLEGFSHIWLVFLFHQNLEQGWKPTVRPPRLGGNQRVGVYASRSPFRPNPIGLSAVKLLDINICGKEISLKVEGPDLIDNTPIIDIKPYVPYSDSISDALGGFADQAPDRLEVIFSDQAQKQLRGYAITSPELEHLLHETLALDPRPAYKRDSDEGRQYGALFDRYNVSWMVEQGRVVVLNIEVSEL